MRDYTITYNTLPRNTTLNTYDVECIGSQLRIYEKEPSLFKVERQIQGIEETE